MVAPQRDPPARPDGWKDGSPPPMPQERPGRLDGLIAAIYDQTAAMRELAESNRQVVDLVIAQQTDAENEDQQPETYLDGEPL